MTEVEPLATSGAPSGAAPQAATAITIDRIGAHGDGVAEAPDGPVFVPFALPGELWPTPAPVGGVQSLVHGPLTAPSPDRIAPICRHFATCGGCVAQHMRRQGPDSLYATWKRGIVVEAFRQRGLDLDVAPLVELAGHSRRRATFTAVKMGTAVRTGAAVRANTLGSKFLKRSGWFSDTASPCPTIFDSTLHGLVSGPKQELSLQIW